MRQISFMVTASFVIQLGQLGLLAHEAVAGESVVVGPKKHTSVLRVDMTEWQEKAAQGSVNDPIWKNVTLGTMNFGRTLFTKPEAESGGDSNSTQNTAKKALDITSDAVTEARFGLAFNQTGAISGKDFSEILKLFSRKPIPTRAELEKMIRLEQEKNKALKPGEAEAELAAKLKEYDQFMVQMRTKIQALLMLTRIVDRESVSLEIPYTISDERVDYVVKSILLISATDQNKAKKTGKVKLDLIEKEETSEVCDISKVAYINGAQSLDFSPTAAGEPLIAQLYSDFRTRIGNQPVSITFDWDYVEAGMNRKLEQLKQEPFGDQWSSVDLKLSPVPESLDEFKRLVASQLHPVYRSFVRDQVLRQILGKKKSTELSVLDLKVNSAEVLRILEQAKAELAKASVETLEGTFQELVMSGQDRFNFARAFREQMQKMTDAILVDSDQILMARLSKQFAGEGAKSVSSEEGVNYQKKSEEIELRKSRIVSEAFAVAQAKFANEIAAKTLSVALRDRLVVETISPLSGIQVVGEAKDSISLSQNELLSSDSKMQRIAEMEMKASKKAGARRLVSCFGASDQDEIRFLFYGKEMKSVAKAPLKLESVLTSLDHFAIGKIKEKWITHYQRAAISSLFSRNYLVAAVDLSADGAWTDFTQNADELSASLFVETVYDDHKGDEIVTKASADDVINNDKRVDYLQSISSPLMGLMKKLPNDRH